MRAGPSRADTSCTQRARLRPFIDQPHCHRPFSDGRGHACDRSVSDVTDVAVLTLADQDLAGASRPALAELPQRLEVGVAQAGGRRRRRPVSPVERVGRPPGRPRAQRGSHRRSTSARTLPARRSGRSDDRARGRGRGHGASATSRSSRRVRTSGTSASAATATRSADILGSLVASAGSPDGRGPDADRGTRRPTAGRVRSGLETVLARRRWSSSFNPSRIDGSRPGPRCAGPRPVRRSTGAPRSLRCA